MTEFRVGRGISDVTGEAAEAGMLGYGKAEQRSDGIHMRLRSRAFVFASGNERVLLVVSELPLMFDSIHRTVLARLADRFGGLYTARNTMLTVTHTHCGPGGYSHHLLYNTTTNGFRPKTFDATVDGTVEAVERAHADVADAMLSLNRGTLENASVNRSRVAFERNPLSDKEFFPDAIDPQITLLRIEREGGLAGAVTWFASHNTSMTNTNTLISSDNKGYAAYHWERVERGVDYLANIEPDFIAAFAQTNAGDMSPNLNLKPGSGPTENEVENTRIIGSRQYDAAAELLAEQAVPLTGGVDSRVVYIDLSDVEVAPEFAGDGAVHHTSGPAVGASALAGAWADGVGFPGFREGANPVFDVPSKLAYGAFKHLRDSQAPKGIVLSGSTLNKIRPLVAERFPVQLLRIGRLYLVGIPGEVTIVSGLRLRRTVAEIVGADLDDVLVAGYSNGYFHYVTTPEEYEAQQYEGGSTLFGRWQLPALQQTAALLARAMKNSLPAPDGVELPTLRVPRSRVPKVPNDVTPPERAFGDVLIEPGPACEPGAQVRATFVGAYPDNDLHRGGTYLEVQQETASGWRRIADDGDFSTTFRWSRDGKARSSIVVTWNVPDGQPAGNYRIGYHGDAAGPGGLTPFTGFTRSFAVG
ncbi:neutral/alkaline non-lysosomal ceramidase N-terminal domain-containing protein [Antrihabitans stalactiti]|uniref:neutral/alkaline non-lysosomal ceramidase N-terminal domain-containing protein n=1 Tax=Antrihabitans stalactiti TaxID=2584121 RepID=UPI0030B84673